jgi:hypothetical protein
MLLVPRNNKFYYHTGCQTLTTGQSNTSIHIVPNINSTHHTLIFENSQKKEIISINRNSSKLLNLWLGAQPV